MATSSNSDLDLALALSLQASYSQQPVEKAATAKQDLGVVDERWELTDPNPNIHQLFVEFDSQFFWGKLVARGVAVAWSSRMTLCAGVCSYEGRGGLCSIRLSQPLLKLRPRRDLVETLLHEMIHAFLFITENNRDHDGHGPQFLSHMNRINQQTGAKISVYHSFHREVREYRQHWWKCDGPCQKRPPYYGLVKRAMNRAPSPRDPWWVGHRQKCGGTFKKIKEPEGFGKKKEKKNSSTKEKGNAKGKGKAGNQDIRELLKKRSGSKSSSPPTTSTSGFEGSGFTLGKGEKGGGGGGGGGGGDLRAKILEAAEKRQTENAKLSASDTPRKRKLTSTSQNSNPEKIPRVANPSSSSNSSDCVIISDHHSRSDKGKTQSQGNVSNYHPTPSVIVIEEEEDTLVKPESSPHSSASPDDTGLVVLDDDDMAEEEYKTCPVCEMTNIPAAIINAHVSLCLEAEEQYTVIEDD